MKFRKISIAFLLLILGATCAYAKKKEQRYAQVHPLTADQTALISKAVAREKIVIKNIKERTPLVETYIQDTRPDAKLYMVPVDDYYVLSRVDFSRAFTNEIYPPRMNAKAIKASHSFFKGSMQSITGLTKMLGLERFTYSPTGFMQMMFLDPTSFDPQHYIFSYVRKEFIGSVRTVVFDVHPKVTGQGRFYGRIWIEDQDGNIVRFNGTYTGNGKVDTDHFYFHFDSWRLNVQPGIWLPVAIYVEETERAEGRDTNRRKLFGLKAQTHFWGYALKLPTHESENVSVKVDEVVDKSEDSEDVGPLQAQRAWITQAENNVLDRLVEAGLLSPPSDFDKVLEQIVTNLAVPSNLAFTDPVRCRILLSNTIEATTVGNTILISKGLLDTLPNEEAMAAVVALELSHIAMGHHIDTRYAFNDRLLFPDESTFQRINMYHTDPDNADAAKKSMELLTASIYKDKMPNAGLYFAQLYERGKVLKNLNTPKLGDSMLKVDGTPWLSELSHSAPKINPDDLSQTAALPLGSWLKTDPWDDRVHSLNAVRYAPMNARDKMPLEVTPMFFKLVRYDVNKLGPGVVAPTDAATPAATSAAPSGSGSAAPTPAPAATTAPVAGTAPATEAQPAAGSAPTATPTATGQGSGASTEAPASGTATPPPAPSDGPTPTTPAAAPAPAPTTPPAADAQPETQPSGN